YGVGTGDTLTSRGLLTGEISGQVPGSVRDKTRQQIERCTQGSGHAGHECACACGLCCTAGRRTRLPNYAGGCGCGRIWCSNGCAGCSGDDKSVACAGEIEAISEEGKGSIQVRVVTVTALRNPAESNDGAVCSVRV